METASALLSPLLRSTSRTPASYTNHGTVPEPRVRPVASDPGEVRVAPPEEVLLRRGVGSEPTTGASPLARAVDGSNEVHSARCVGPLSLSP